MPVQIKPAISTRPVLVNRDFVIPVGSGDPSANLAWIPAFAGMTYDLIWTAMNLYSNEYT